MKTCGTCKESLPDEAFSLRDATKGTRQSKCKECQKRYKATYYSDNKSKIKGQTSARRIEYRKAFYAWLKTKQCLDCGNSDYRVLEFDHLNDKSFSISEKIGSRTLPSLQEELAKCEIVCANCHRIRTTERGNYLQYVE